MMLLFSTITYCLHGRILRHSEVPLRPMAMVLTQEVIQPLRNVSREADNLNLETCFYLMLPLKKAVYGIEGLGMKITLPTLAANFCFNVLDEIQSAMKPVLFTDLLLGGFPSTEFTDHGSVVLPVNHLLANSLNDCHSIAFAVAQSGRSERSREQPC